MDDRMTTTTFDSPTATPTEIVQQVKTLDDFLQNTTIDDQTMKAADFLGIRNDTPAFNERFINYEHILECDADEHDDSNLAFTDIPPKITETIEIMSKPRVLAKSNLNYTNLMFISIQIIKTNVVKSSASSLKMRSLQGLPGGFAFLQDSPGNLPERLD